MRILITLLLLALPAAALAQTGAGGFPLTAVCDLKVDDDGDCITDRTGDEVCVEGIVVAWKQFGNRGPGAIYDPVSGCCISIFDINNEPDLAVGTKVRVCGWVGNFAGLMEIIDEPGNASNDPVVTVLDPGPLPFPVPELTGADLADDSPIAEQMESCLIQICGSFVDDGDFLPFSSNYDFVDVKGQTITVRIDSDTGIEGTPIPTGLVTLYGIVGQFNGFQDNCTGYQVLPRSLDDFLPPRCTAGLDIKPGSCPNPLNPKSNGVLPVALLGSETFNIADVDISSLTLEGVDPLRYALGDVSGPPSMPMNECDCSGAMPDGSDDLVLKFDTQAIVMALGPLTGGDFIELTLTGVTNDGAPFSATDCMRVTRVGPMKNPRMELSRARQVSPGGPAEIVYAVPEPMQIELTVVDVTGRRVASLVRAHVGSGEHRVMWDVGTLSSGVYFLRLAGAQEQDVSRIVIQR